jgi:hypothetical protein
VYINKIIHCWISNLYGFHCLLCCFFGLLSVEGRWVDGESQPTFFTSAKAIKLTTISGPKSKSRFFSAVGNLNSCKTMVLRLLLVYVARVFLVCSLACCASKQNTTILNYAPFELYFQPRARCFVEVFSVRRSRVKT